MKWEPIETAPHNTVCLIWSKGFTFPAFATCVYGNEYDGIYNGCYIWIGMDDDSYYPDASHWMPIPKGPKE